MDEEEKGSIEWFRKKYPRSELEWKPASMQPGSDRLAFFWIGYAVVVFGGMWLLTQTPVLDWLGL